MTSRRTAYRLIDEVLLLLADAELRLALDDVDGGRVARVLLGNIVHRLHHRRRSDGYE